MRAKDVTGMVGEQIAADYLGRQGHQILERRWRGAHGELDLITRDGAHLVAVEVKTRRGIGYGHPFEAVNGRKLARLHRLLLEYCVGQQCLQVPRRVDVVAVLLSGAAAAHAEEHLIHRLEHLKDVS
ncbi:YraN family protein [Nesterenkonia sp. LB17]|uniref:YraN family protein n=1 Tax=unclassified Nesterenkonia TaxID=2629769 RepID=UPI001F4CE8E8|nr:MULTISPECIES: YraN family protein [unclassified Nesterenkonia]MCH8561241.1 YraN family protein [Nesterenkonia sp. DZ6]MCH8562460.1 YraN family protein [Nesterenkonia sp. YGD6]MCH8565383.1 YraN family protein [Nesterenkonia sp. LB17]